MLYIFYHAVFLVNSFPDLFALVCCIWLLIFSEIHIYGLNIIFLLCTPFIHGLRAITLCIREGMIKHLRGRFLELLFPEKWNFIVFTFTYCAFFTIAHSLNCPERTFILHVDFIGSEEWCQLNDIYKSHMNWVTLSFSKIGYNFLFKSFMWSIGAHIP